VVTLTELRASGHKEPRKKLYVLIFASKWLLDIRGAREDVCCFGLHKKNQTLKTPIGVLRLDHGNQTPGRHQRGLINRVGRRDAKEG